MDESRKQLAKQYEKIKLTVGITEAIISFFILLGFVALGYSKKLEHFVYQYTDNPYIALIYFGLIIGVVSSVISFPVDYIFGFRLEHKFGLSNQTFAGWLTERLKGVLVGGILAAPIAFLFYWLISSYELWWLYLAVIILIYSVLLAQIAPVLIFPLFYKFKPIENEELKNRLMKMCDKVGFKVKGVYTFNMSKNTKKANAAFTGIGKTKRIILGDTLMETFTDDEIETVFAHELGHYKKGHIKKNILASVLGTFIKLFIMAEIYTLLLPVFGFQHPWEIGALPLLGLIIAVLSFISSPLLAGLSRKFEFEADRFAIDLTHNIAAFKSTMTKLVDQNLSNDEPNKVVEFWTHSHPAVKKRIEAAEDYYSLISQTA